MSEIRDAAEERMKKAIAALHDNFTTVRTGRANAMILDRIKVDYYGVQTPINQMAAVKTPDAHMLVVEPWDKGMLRAIEHAIMESDLGVTPSNDGACIRLPFPVDRARDASARPRLRVDRVGARCDDPHEQLAQHGRRLRRGDSRCHPCCAPRCEQRHRKAEEGLRNLRGRR